MSSMSNAAKPSVAQELLSTAWPPAQAGESEFQRRRKLAVRGGQLAMMVLVAVAVISTFMPHAEVPSAARLLALSATAIAYILWSIYGLRTAVQSMLRPMDSVGEEATAPAASRWRVAAYFAVQFALAELMYLLGDRGRVTAVMWLVLLPPVAHSVILLKRPGVIVVCSIAIALFIANMVRWYGWNLTQNAALAFLFSVTFTVVFTFLAVTAEQSRQRVHRMAAELSDANRKLREYAVKVEELSAARERNRLAREIHDTLGHYLTVVNVQLEAVRAVQQHSPEKAQEALQTAQKMTLQGLQEVRRSVSSLRASPLDHKTIVEAVKQCVEESKTSGISARFEIVGAERALSPQAQLTLFRAVQEGLTNVHKHARATTVTVLIDFTRTNQTSLRVTDNGVGAKTTEGGFGLIGLRERVALLNGRLRTETSPGAGFMLEVGLPA